MKTLENTMVTIPPGLTTETLFAAIERCDLDNLSLHIANGINLNARNVTNFTPLHLGVIRGYLDVVNMLLSTQANALRHLRTESGYTALELALHGIMCEQDPTMQIIRLRIVDNLIYHGANVSQINDDGSTLLSIAIDDPPLLNLLIQHRINVNRLNINDTMTPLFYAVSLDYMQSARMLLERGADVNAIYNNRTALHVAIRRQNLEIVVLLVSGHADVNACNDYMAPPLIFGAARAYRMPNLAIIKTLLDNQADPNVANSEGKTALHFLINKEEMVEKLLSHGANPWAISICLMLDTPLSLARKRKNRRIKSMLENAAFSFENRFNKIKENNPHLSSIYPCPLSGKIMNDPVTLSSGITYDRESLRQYILGLHDDVGIPKKFHCPITRIEIDIYELLRRTNVQVKQWIEDSLRLLESQYQHHAMFAPLSRHVAKNLQCPLSGEKLTDPITLSSGVTVNRLALQAHFERNGNPETLPCPVLKAKKKTCMISLKEAENKNDVMAEGMMLKKSCVFNTH